MPGGERNRQGLPRSEYYAYIRSEKWKKVRERYWKSKQPKVCFICGTAKELDLHHRTYKRLGCEHLRDLVALCRTCHNEVHDILKKTNDRRVTNVYNVAFKIKRRNELLEKQKHTKNPKRYTLPRF